MGFIFLTHLEMTVEITHKTSHFSFLDFFKQKCVALNTNLVIFWNLVALSITL